MSGKSNNALKFAQECADAARSALKFRWQVISAQLPVPGHQDGYEWIPADLGALPGDYVDLGQAALNLAEFELRLAGLNLASTALSDGQGCISDAMDDRKVGFNSKTIPGANGGHS